MFKTQYHQIKMGRSEPILGDSFLVVSCSVGGCGRVYEGAWGDSLRCHASWVPVAHTCNPSYSGGRDQEDQGSKPAQASSS
jgi:hypothetical protein